jgi:hypothetical protein
VIGRFSRSALLDARESRRSVSLGAGESHWPVSLGVGDSGSVVEPQYDRGEVSKGLGESLARVA